LNFNVCLLIGRNCAIGYKLTVYGRKMPACQKMVLLDGTFNIFFPYLKDYFIYKAILYGLYD